MPAYVDHDSATFSAVTSVNLSGLNLSAVGSNGVLYATMAAFGGTSRTASWNSEGMTEIYHNNPAPVFVDVSIWRRTTNDGLDAGAHTLALSWTSSTSGVAAGIAFSDVDQSTPNDAQDAASGEDTAVANSVTSATGDLVFDIVLAGEASSATTSNTERVDLQNAGENLLLLISHAAGAASVDMNWTLSAVGAWNSFAYNLNAAAAAGRTTKNTRSYPLGMFLGIRRGFGGL